MKLRLLVIFAPVLLMIYSCGGHSGSSHQKVKHRTDTIDLVDIIERDTLIALIGYSSTSYFIYKGKAMGYEYELLKKFADHLGVNLEIRIVKNLNNIFDELNNLNGDLIGHAMTVTNDRKQIVNFTDPLNYTEQVLVQRRPKNWWNINPDKLEKKMVRSVIDLLHKEVHVKKGSAYYQRLVNLGEELGDSIHINIVEGDVSTEDLIEMVAKGKIDYTVADENIAIINQGYYNNIDIKTKVSFPQRSAWAMRKSSPQLLETFNEWLAKMKKTTYYYVLYNKYYKNRSVNKIIFESDFSSHNGKSISPYDDLFKNEAHKIKGWDWRLLAAQVYQESKWDAMAESWMGAFGLMQVVPETSDMYGFYDLLDPAENIVVGVKHLSRIAGYFEELDSAERIKFSLASYNVGYGHIKDARALALKYGKNPDVWDNNVDTMLILKGKKEYYSDPVVSHGYCNGKETYTYVKNILEQYNHYKQFFK